METNTSQNSVATYEGVVGPLYCKFIQNLQMEEFWIDRNMPMSLMCSFFWPTLYIWRLWPSSIYWCIDIVNLFSPFAMIHERDRHQRDQITPPCAIICMLFLDKFWKLLTSYAFLVLPLTVAKLSTVNNNPSFLAHRVYRHYRGLVQKLFSRHTDRPWHSQRFDCYIHCVSKKQDTKLLPITSPNVNRFSKFFHWQTHW